MSLAQLGRDLCMEFDSLEKELQNLNEQSRHHVKVCRSDLLQQRDADRVEQREGRIGLQQDMHTLFKQYKADHHKRLLELRDAQSAQFKEMTLWARERKSQLDAWHEAGRYLLRKRAGR